MELAKYSIGVGDRFGQEADAQLAAVMEARRLGMEVVPVWNKSNREHTIIGTEPASVRAEVEAAVAKVGYKGEYHVDADHITIKTVDWFLDSSDFFTLDVADFIGKCAAGEDIDAFLERHGNLIGHPLEIPGIEETLVVSPCEARAIAEKILLAIQEAGRLYRAICAKKGGEGSFIVEISMDETDVAQSPTDMLFILAAIADERIPAQTIAPKFSGRFNKGIDYVGDLARFDREFNGDLAVIAFAVKLFGLMPNLKLSVHSGSDKFSIYPIINRALRKSGAGLHLKTAGTTWLEELIGLAEAGGDGLALAKDIYAIAYQRFDELKKPYETVIDIDWNALPRPDMVAAWSETQFASALRHDQSNPEYNRHFRQMLHVAFKVAAEKGDAYLEALARHRASIARNVAENILERHLKPIFSL